MTYVSTIGTAFQSGVLERRSIHVKHEAMATKPERAGRRTGPLTKARILEAAIEILDAHGEDALTFRALAAVLATGSGAIYWHVADKHDLLTAAADHIVERAMDRIGSGTDPDPRAAIRAIALAMFDAFIAHTWIGIHLSPEPKRSALLLFFEGIGGRLLELDVPERERFGAWSTLVNYILGVAGQNAANARCREGKADRTAFLTTVASRWAQLDSAEYPFLREVAARLPEHDDREQFVEGVDLILASICGAAGTGHKLPTAEGIGTIA